MLRHQTKIRTYLGTREELQIIGRDVVASAVLEIARISATTVATSVLTILLCFSAYGSHIKTKSDLPQLCGV